MKISPILNSYCSDTNKSKQKTPFKRIITTPADIQKVVKSPLSDSQKKLFLDAYEKAKDYLEELDADINLEYRPKDKKKYFFETCGKKDARPARSIGVSCALRGNTGKTAF